MIGPGMPNLKGNFEICGLFYFLPLALVLLLLVSLLGTSCRSPSGDCLVIDGELEFRVGQTSVAPV